MPEPGLYFKEYNYFYTTDTFKNFNGDKVSAIPLPGGGTANVKVDVNLFATAPTLLWVSDWTILGARYGAYISPTFSNSSLGASVTTTTGLGRNVNQSSFGFGDLFVQPLWLGWNFEHWDFAFGYGFYAPTGRFSPGASDNVGLGFWSHQFQGTVAWYPIKDRTNAFLATVTYEINQKIEGEDLTPGQRLSVNLGADHLEPLGASGFVLELGVEGGAQWQTTDDNGSDAFRPGVHDQIFSFGPQVGLIYAPWNLALTLKWEHEFLAEDRFEGENVTFNIGAGF